jgi:uncharacterized membrane protein
MDVRLGLARHGGDAGDVPGAGEMAAVVVARLLGPREQPGSGSRPAERSAIEILQERFANGEIDEEEFQRRRELLSS